MKWLISTALGLMVLGVAIWNPAVGEDSSPTAKASSRDDSPSIDPLARQIQGIGFVEPAGEVRRLMLRTGGVIKDCPVHCGDLLKKGEVIMTLDDSTQRAELEVAKAQLELAKADAENVNVGVNPYRLKVVEQAIERIEEKHRFIKMEAERSRILIASRATSRQEHDAIESQYRQVDAELREQKAELSHLKHLVTAEQRAMASAKVRQAEAQLSLANERLEESTLKAPFDGMVLKVLKREGEGVRMFEPEPVVLYGDITRLRVRAEVDERFVQRLALGSSVRVYGRNLGNQDYTGRVVEIERMMGDKTVFTGSSSERKDLDVLEVVIEMGDDFRAPVGLRVDVSIAPASADPIAHK